MITKIKMIYFENKICENLYNQLFIINFKFNYLKMNF